LKIALIRDKQREKDWEPFESFDYEKVFIRVYIQPQLPDLPGKSPALPRSTKVTMSSRGFFFIMASALLPLHRNETSS
jgi:hypothetical protein